MHIPITNLFSAYDLQVNPLTEDKIRSQDVVNYCEARFRVALQAMMGRSEKDQRWMYKFLFQEMVNIYGTFAALTLTVFHQELCFSHIGVAAAIGQPLNIPVIVRSLGQDLYRVGMIPDGVFRPGLELMTYLDGNLSSNGLDDPALEIRFYAPWWDHPNAPTRHDACLSLATLKSALKHFKDQLAAVMKPITVPHTIRNLADELNKPAYTWHSSANDRLPNDRLPNTCTRCRLYRSVAVGVLDQLRDTYNMVHACEVANEAEKAIAIRRASGFNELYEAAVKKECDHQYLEGSERPLEETDPGLPHTKQLLKILVSKLSQENASAWKWTWGVDLNEDDLSKLIRGANRNNDIPHSGYDQDLPSGSLQSQTSHALDPAMLEDPNDSDLLFDDISSSIGMVPELGPHEIPVYSGILLDTSGDALAESEPDPVIEAFTKRAEKKAKKLIMQDEVDQPVSYLDQGSQFNPRMALIPSRPWLVPHLPMIHPPNNMQPPDSEDHEPDTHEKSPDHIILPDSEDEDDHIKLPDSADEDTNDDPDNLMLPDSGSSQSSIIHFPMSDDEDDVMDVVGSGEQIVPAGATLGSPIVIDDSDSESEHVATKPSIGGSGVIERDPATGRFSAASFAHFPDDLVD